MRFPDQAPVRPQKKQELQERIEKLGIDLDEVEATYVRASGPGGQKINKTSSAVVLRYAPLGIVVKWSRERSRALNQFLALRELVDEIEIRISPQTSKRLQQQRRIHARKTKRHKPRSETPPS
ncbi:MAG TPA: peptide chain release factor-like protein [Polyangiaceae bacterium]|jgi:protein subunit release factor B|nr:MAG: Peptide chain release factor 1 [Deltaproteobacteria bacterium ADurb.Bin207]HNS98176.1 peptide chain release factor-like protein [Polyangiaceae bacterium]HNZ23840.1 peptide chain release factor-like protein [Polyangiaceae bacterium]HOD22367.1 peptide chain release factor-like protein [Polyangiaceae bacterium]HOE50268.1 peptide chain release factor-like protein [Polyangiaceae bacterium]